MLSIIFLAFLAVSSGAPAPTVTLGRTRIIGSQVANVEFFGGIPFAEPPLGQLRLASPVLQTTINAATFQAAKFGASCLQNALPANEVSEDCLNLNIFRPAGTEVNSNLPVMVWLYGVGSSSLYDATELVARSVTRGTPVIFVSINYRLGPLGFPQGIEAGLRNITNLGLQDQLVALEWVQENIARFGGSKNAVTVIGQSAGADSISLHFLGSKLKTLARAAILESTVMFPTFGPERNDAIWQSFVGAVPACADTQGTNSTFACLRTASTASLLQALTTAGIFGNSTDFLPVIDGPNGLLPDRPSLLPQRSRLPALIGSNLDEGTLFVPQDVTAPDQITQFLTQFTTPTTLVSPLALAATLEEVLNLYADVPALGSPFGTGNNTFGLAPEYKRFAAIQSDFLFQSARRTFSQQTSAAGTRVFGYLFNDPDAVAQTASLPATPPAPGSLGIPHSSELDYVFNTLVNKTPTAIALSRNIQDYWLSFATSLTPNDGRGARRPTWEQFTPKNQILMQLNGHATQLIPDNFRANGIQFFQNNPDALHR
ncbi:hypothetical protein HYPSUDRAFT_76245 [Hypholoma sublateritium FD-334 SS-4]|uniref:Carboxylic ester hydrolase n=1 Tax=Hypholoma sublateritium (strain FD-334 SS-4) TaxID=945553 RepID=A0A0D2P1T3_HYPSF|nr:hypothetical protein HYPSUDRAFT_76245 [Hypholoma sublateritium FD-334 SS-4]